MCIRTIICIVSFLIIIITPGFSSDLDNDKVFRFTRKIEAIGWPYYKILMYLGQCQERLVFSEQKIWPAIAMYSIFDIYYRSENDYENVSRVEIRIIINNTHAAAFSSHGVGQKEFYGVLYLPMNIDKVYYALNIYTCSNNTDYNSSTSNGTKLYLPYYRSTPSSVSEIIYETSFNDNMKKLTFYQQSSEDLSITLDQKNNLELDFKSHAGSSKAFSEPKVLSLSDSDASSESHDSYDSMGTENTTDSKVTEYNSDSIDNIVDLT